VVATVVPPTKVEVVAEAATPGAPSAPAAPAKGGTRAPGKTPAKK
jgi:hypothetical protein